MRFFGGRAAPTTKASGSRSGRASVRPLHERLTLLQRNLLYTAITRAKRRVVLAGSRKALAIAVRTAGTGRRHTALTHRLQKPGNTAC